MSDKEWERVVSRQLVSDPPVRMKIGYDAFRSPNWIFNRKRCDYPGPRWGRKKKKKEDFVKQLWETEKPKCVVGKKVSKQA